MTYSQNKRYICEGACLDNYRNMKERIEVTANLDGGLELSFQPNDLIKISALDDLHLAKWKLQENGIQVDPTLDIRFWFISKLEIQNLFECSHFNPLEEWQPSRSLIIGYKTNQDFPTNFYMLIDEYKYSIFVNYISQSFKVFKFKEPANIIIHGSHTSSKIGAPPTINLKINVYKNSSMNLTNEESNSYEPHTMLKISATSKRSMERENPKEYLSLSYQHKNEQTVLHQNISTQYDTLETWVPFKLNFHQITRLIDFVLDSEQIFNQGLEENETFDFTRDDLENIYSDKSLLINNEKIDSFVLLNTYFDSTYSKMCRVTSFSWCPKEPNTLFGVGYEQLSKLDKKSIYSPYWTYTQPHFGLIWDIRNRFSPLYVLFSYEAITKISFSPQIPGIIVSGCRSGKIVIWQIKDLSDYEIFFQKEPVDTIPPLYLSELGSSHSSSIIDIRWIPNGTKSQFITCAAEAIFILWDLPINLPLKAFGNIITPLKKFNINEICLSKSANRDCYFTRFVESELKVLHVWIAMTDEELVLQPWPLPQFKVKTVDIYTKDEVVPRKMLAFEISPFNNDIFLTINDWEFVLHMKGLKQPIYTSPKSFEHYTSGCWSLTRPSVFYLAKMNGFVEAWSIIDNFSHHETIFHVSDKPTVCINTHLVKDQYLLPNTFLHFKSTQQSNDTTLHDTYHYSPKTESTLLTCSEEISTHNYDSNFVQCKNESAKFHPYTPDNDFTKKLSSMNNIEEIDTKKLHSQTTEKSYLRQQQKTSQVGSKYSTKSSLQEVKDTYTEILSVSDWSGKVLTFDIPNHLQTMVTNEDQKLAEAISKLQEQTISWIKIRNTLQKGINESNESGWEAKDTQPNEEIDLLKFIQKLDYNNYESGFERALNLWNPPEL